MLNPELVIFDMDGLMFDTERLLMKHTIEVASKMGCTITKDIYKEIIGTGTANTKEVFDKYLPNDYPLEEGIANVMASMKADILQNGLPMKKGLHQLLDYLKESNIVCCIASSSPLKLIKFYLQLTGLESYFSGIISGDSVKNTKPDPAIFNKALEQFDVLPENALVLEDSKNGITAAYRANIPCVCVPDIIVPDREMINQATFITSSLDNVIDLITDNIADCA